MWNERYDSADYFYGTEPNDFLREHAGMLQSPVLSLAEGEGRNAVYLASLGLSVLGVDGSAVGLAKANSLAAQRGVTIQTDVADLSVYTPAPNTYGTVVSIFAHLPFAIRHRLYPLVVQSLQPGGIFLLEAYSEEQLTRSTGGPNDLDMLMSVEKIRNEFPSLTPILLQSVERDVSEGQGHTGLASVVQFIGKKT